MPWNCYAVDDPDRAIGAVEELLSLLLYEDPRVQAAFMDWITALPPPPALPSRIDLQDAIARLVSDLGLSFAWLADFLEMLFFQMALVDEPVAFSIVEPSRAVEPLPGEPLKATLRRAGKIGRREGLRRPTAGGDVIRRDVRWWYRHRVDPEHVSIRTLGREWLAGAQRTDDGASTVYPAIQRIDRVFGQIGTGGMSRIMLMFHTAPCTK